MIRAFSSQGKSWRKAHYFIKHKVDCHMVRSTFEGGLQVVTRTASDDYSKLGASQGAKPDFRLDAESGH